MPTCDSAAVIACKADKGEPALRARRFTGTQGKDCQMDKDRIEGAGKTMGGKIKEAAGKVTGDKKMETEGKAKQVEGKVQNAYGGAKDALKGK
jgi:uncharacterized protein YjbJ (UPF0337 family)